jgi:hypothetical protein
VLQRPLNYTISYANGVFYVNPKGNGAKNVKPKLDCVDTLYQHPSGFRYVAHFSYENPNPTPVYVPIGPNNNLTSAGFYSGVQPILFYPSGGSFDIYFDGQTLKWQLITFNGNQKTSTSSSASSTSNKCGTSLIARSGKVSEETVSTQRPVAASLPEDRGILAYPNPVQRILYVDMHGQKISRQQVVITDILGHSYMRSGQLMNGGRLMKLDLEGLPAGMLLVKLYTGNNTFTIVKILKTE